MEVNRENMQKWVDALRSGQYLQGMGDLQRRGVDGNRFCCLGVACDISGVGRWGSSPTYPYYVTETERINGSTLPVEVQNWLGINSPDPFLMVDETGTRRSAIELNDDLRYTFAQIADAIERTYLS